MNLPSSHDLIFFIACAGSIATLCTYPFDLLRTRFAVQGHSKVYVSLARAIWQISKEEGVTGFYRGLWPAMVQIVPYMGIMFSTQGYLKEKLKVGWLRLTYRIILFGKWTYFFEGIGCISTWIRWFYSGGRCRRCKQDIGHAIGCYSVLKLLI